MKGEHSTFNIEHPMPEKEHNAPGRIRTLKPRITRDPLPDSTELGVERWALNVECFLMAPFGL
jgi:hypothetical protein